MKTPEELRRIDEIARHLGRAAEEVARDMLMQDGKVATANALGLGWGVLIAPIPDVVRAKAFTLATHGGELIDKSMTYHTELPEPKGPDDPCMN